MTRRLDYSKWDHIEVGYNLLPVGHGVKKLRASQFFTTCVNNEQ